MRSKIDLEQLAKEIRVMSFRSELYRVLKRELSARGWWKNRARYYPKGRPKHLESPPVRPKGEQQ